MLKKFVQVFVWMILLCRVVTGLAEAQSMQEPELLPEVHSLINELPLLTENELRQNAASGLMGITAPAGTDYMKIGASIMINNRQTLIEGLKVQSSDEEHFPVFTIENYLNGQSELNIDMNVDGEFYKFACSIPENDDCIAQILEDKVAIEMLIIRNRELMERYLEIIDLSQYNSYTYRISEPLPPLHMVINLGDLHLAQAVLALNDGRSDDAYAILCDELTFTKLMLEGDGSLIDKMIAIQRLSRFYQTLESIIDQQSWLRLLSMDQWRILISPLSEQEQRGWGKAFIHERNWGIFGLYMLDDTNQSDARSVLEQLAFDVAYNRLATVNTTYLSWQPVIELAMMNQSRISLLLTQRTFPNLQEEREQILQDQNKIYAQQYGELFNAVGKILMDFSSDYDWTRYFYRFYNAQIYMALVNVKYEILSAGVNAQGIPAFLEGLGDKAINPFTREPFIWDEKAGELRTSRLVESNNVNGATNLEAIVHITINE